MPERYELLYGRSKIAVAVSDDCDVTVVRKAPMPVLPDPDGAIAGALDGPMGLPPLGAGGGARSACILICDITRPVPNKLFLQPLIRRLMAAGVPAEGITVLVATGLHRPNEGEELAELVGDPWVMQTVRVANHFAVNDDDHVDLGVTKGRGVPVKLDRRFVEADIKIATGLVEPHFMAGFSGGRKVIAPGVAHQDTIRTFHSARFMEHPAATQCNLAGNPLHEEQLEIVGMLGQVYGLNTVIDEERRLSCVTFGEIIESHLAAVDFVADRARVPVPRRFHTVVTSAAGYPLDKNYYQTVKGMVTPIDIFADDADLIIASDCSEGLGSPEYRGAQERMIAQGPDAFLEGLLAKSKADIDEWQTEMQLKPMRRARKVQLYSEGLPAADRAMTGVEIVDDLDAAVQASVDRAPDRAVAVIPEGPYVVPYYQPQG